MILGLGVSLESCLPLRGQWGFPQRFPMTGPVPCSRCGADVWCDLGQLDRPFFCEFGHRFAAAPPRGLWVVERQRKRPRFVLGGQREVERWRVVEGSEVWPDLAYVFRFDESGRPVLDPGPVFGDHREVEREAERLAREEGARAAVRDAERGLEGARLAELRERLSEAYEAAAEAGELWTAASVDKVAADLWKRWQG